MGQAGELWGGYDDAIERRGEVSFGGSTEGGEKSAESAYGGSSGAAETLVDAAKGAGEEVGGWGMGCQG